MNAHSKFLYIPQNDYSFPNTISAFKRQRGRLQPSFGGKAAKSHKVTLAAAAATASSADTLGNSALIRPIRWQPAHPAGQLAQTHNAVYVIVARSQQQRQHWQHTPHIIGGQCALHHRHRGIGGAIAPIWPSMRSRRGYPLVKWCVIGFNGGLSHRCKHNEQCAMVKLGQRFIWHYSRGE